LKESDERQLRRGKHLVLSVSANNLSIKALLDNGSEADLIDQSFTRKQHLPTFRLRKPIPLKLGDGTPYRNLTEAAMVDLQIGDHHEQKLFYIVPGLKYKLILGDNWLQDHNPQINWKERAVSFNAAECLERGCLHKGRPCTVYESGYIPPLTGSGLDIATISARAFFHLARKSDHHGFMLTPKDNEKYFCASTTNAVTTDDYDTFMKGKPTYSRAELLARVPAQFHSEIEVFIKSNADKLPPHRAEDHKIQLMEGTTAPFARL